MIKITISEFKEKYTKLILKFEKKTRHKAFWHNNITGRFKDWLLWKLDKDIHCDINGNRFETKQALTTHKRWRKPGY